MEKHRIKKHLLALTLLKNQKNIYAKYQKFYQPGLELEVGDYILGSFKITADKFKEAENLGIRIFLIPDTPKWPGLKIQGNQKTDQNGFRVLIPIKM